MAALTLTPNENTSSSASWSKNPFDVGGTAATGADLYQAQTSTAQVDPAKNTSVASSSFTPASTATYNAAQMTGNLASTERAQAAGYNAEKIGSQGYDAQQAGLNNWNVTGNQTVADQINGLISANSPLLQQARANALAQMNGKGLLNSSMAIGAGQQAAYNAALPIAQADAATYANAAKYNADAANQNSQFNANSTNTARQFGAQAANTAQLANAAAANNALQFNAGNQQQVNLTNAAASNNTSQFNANSLNQAAANNQAATNAASQANASALNQTAQFNSQNAMQNSQFNAQQSNAISEANAQRQQAANVANAAATNETVKQTIDNAFKAKIASADNQTKVTLQGIQKEAQQYIADSESKYKQLMQTSAAASELYGQFSKNVADLTANPDLSPYATTDGKVPAADGSNLPAGARVVDGKVYGADGKQIPSSLDAAIKRQQEAFTNGMSILDTLNTNVSGLKDLISFADPLGANFAGLPGANAGPSQTTTATPAATSGTTLGTPPVATRPTTSTVASLPV